MLIVSRDRTVLDYARTFGAGVLAESGDNLDLALRQASEWARSAGADAVLVLHADLPLITVEDVRQLCVLGRSGVDVVLAASQDGGTNALYLRFPSVVDFQFGPDSFERHRQLAATARATVAIYQSPTIALDLDRPEDLLALGEQFPPEPADC